MQRAPRCSTATLFLSVSLVDGYLALKEVKRDSLQLLVVAALFAAAKFVELTQQTCSKQDILTMEAKLLTAVEFRLCRPTAAHFADRYLQKHACEEVQGAVLAYLLQLALMEFSMLRYTPSEQVAAAALVSSRITGDQALQPCITRAAAPKREQRVVKCAVTLCRLLQAAPQSPWQAVRRKFIRSRNPEEKRRQLSLERRHRSDLEKEVESLRSQVALLMQRGPAPGLAAAAALAVGPKKLTRSALTSVASQVVFRCAPVVAVLHDWALAKYCSRCLKAVGADGTRCPRCRAVTFCKACRQLTAAKLQHRSECQALRRLRSDRPLRRKLHLKKGQGKDATSMMRLALRLLSDVIHDSWEDVEMLTPSEEDLDAMVEAGYDCHCKSWVLRPCCSQSLPGWRGQQLEGGANAVRLLFTARRDEIYHLLCRRAVQPDGAAAEVLQWKRLASKREQQLQREEREEQTGKITQVEYSNADALEGFQSNRRTRQALMRDHYGSFRLGGVADAS
eukprot:s1422_g2.t2